MKECDGTFESIGWNVGEVVQRKQRAYGDSFGKSGECLRQMYPSGIKPEQYDDLLTVARILDKLFRIANNPTAFDENPYQDIVGYGLLGMKRHNSKSKGKSPANPLHHNPLAYAQDGNPECKPPLT
tara:strand:- start:249 stop:626 length:378 start_codon:yes stop_codon:yes gene_type:complete